MPARASRYRVKMRQCLWPRAHRMGRVVYRRTVRRLLNLTSNPIVIGLHRPAYHYIQTGPPSRFSLRLRDRRSPLDSAGGRPQSYSFVNCRLWWRMRWRDWRTCCTACGISVCHETPVVPVDVREIPSHHICTVTNPLPRGKIRKQRGEVNRWAKPAGHPPSLTSVLPCPYEYKSSPPALLSR